MGVRDPAPVSDRPGSIQERRERNKVKGIKRGGGRKESHQEGQQRGGSGATKDVGLVFGLTNTHTQIKI